MIKTEKGLMQSEAVWRVSAQGQVTERVSLCHPELEKITPSSGFEEASGQKKVFIF